MALVLAPLWGGAVESQPDLRAPGQTVEVSGHRMHIHCMGHGAPSVVLEAGLGGSSLDWVRVEPALAADTRVCAYDRAGYGWSEPGPEPRTSLSIVRELHELLDAARIPGPYVLVGHSFGGLNVRLFASLYPQATAGLVLVDSTHEKQIELFERSAGVSTAPRGRFVLLSRPTLPPGLPAEVRPLAETLANRRSALHALRSEMAGFRESAAQVAQAPALPAVPLVVVTRGCRVWPATERGSTMEHLWRELQRDLTQRNGRGVQVFAPHSGHYIPLEQPETVIEATRAVVTAVREHVERARVAQVNAHDSAPTGSPCSVQ